jgi:23S rRNA (adenine1618-N6)-methyltransferase
MHPKNIHQNKYDIDKLCQAFPALRAFVFVNKYGTQTINFSSDKAVKALNTALLKFHYAIDYWQFPDNNLCPPIPGRADYLHHLNELLNLPKQARILDIGTGATVIYPLLGLRLFDWQFVASEINSDSYHNAIEIVAKNELTNQIEVRLQQNHKHILNGIVQKNEKFTASICNPPFFQSKKAALQANARKVRGLNKKKVQKTVVNQNFSGISDELWTVGGEKAFVTKYIDESLLYKNQFEWFTSLISNKDNLKALQYLLQKQKAKTKIIEMSQGNKTIHILAWRYTN